MGLKYTSELAFNRFLGMDAEVPMLSEGSNPSLENVGTGNSSNQFFYMDNKYVINNSEVLKTGSLAESGATTTLNKDIDYTISYDKSKITLISPAGVSSVGNNSIFAEYFYNKFGIKNELISEVLERAENELDSRINSVFTSGAVSSPAYTSVLNEIHEGMGDYNRVYQTDFYPLNTNKSVVSGAVIVGANTIVVSDSTNGFPTNGYLGINTNKINYTSKTSNSFLGVTGVSTALSGGETILPFVIERSITSEGTVPSWEVLSYGSDYDIDVLSGEVKLNQNTVVGSISFDIFNPPSKVWNRVRFTYSYGYDNIPGEIVRCVHLIAAKELYNAQVLNAISRGTNGFMSEAIMNSDLWIEKIINKYNCIKIKNLNN